MSNLWNLRQEYVELGDALVETRGEVTPEIQALMDKADTNTIATVFSLQDVREQLKDYAEICKKRADEFYDKATRYLAAEKKLKQIQIDALAISGRKSIANGAHKMTLQPTPLKIEVVSREEIPNRYLNVSLTVTMDEYQKIKELGITPIKAKTEENKKLLAEDYKRDNIEVSGVEYTTDVTIRVT